MIDEAAIRLRYQGLEPVLDERARRRFAAAEAQAAGHGGGGGGGGAPGGRRRPGAPAPRGDPERPLLWTAKSLRNLTAGLCALGHRVSHNTGGTLLRTLGYSLQANRKTREGASHPDRDAQFHYINDRVKEALAAGEPASSVDTKKREPGGRCPMASAISPTTPDG